MSGYTLVIGNKNYSSWSLRPWIWMKQAGIPFNEKRIALFTESYRDELRPYGSNHRVPVLLDGEFQVWDTIAILEYLAETHPEANGWPQDTRARAVARSVSAEMHSSFTALRNAMPMNCRKRFPEFRFDENVSADIDRVISLWDYCRKDYGEGGEWLFGSYSIADAMFAPIVLRFNSYDVAVSGVAEDYMHTTLADRHIQDWIAAGRQEKEVIAEDEI
jgi:glutathione S-transferase